MLPPQPLRQAAGADLIVGCVRLDVHPLTVHLDGRQAHRAGTTAEIDDQLSLETVLPDQELAQVYRLLEPVFLPICQARPTHGWKSQDAPAVGVVVVEQ